MTAADCPEAKPFSIVPDREQPGLFHVQCPHCGALDEIVEVDVAVRWNRLYDITPEGAFAATGDGDYEFADWQCAGCMSTRLVQPEGWQIRDWS